MGLIVGAVVAAMVWLALWRTKTLSRSALRFLGAALLLGLGGYAVQGRSGLAGSPASERGPVSLPPAMPVALAEEFYGRFNAAYPWLVLANSYLKQGDSRAAVATLQSAVRARPRDSELWVDLANAIRLHGGGRSTPASGLAFLRGSSVAPRHPGPDFFAGLALLEEGQVDRALILWRRASAKVPTGSALEAKLASSIMMIEQLQATTR